MARSSSDQTPRQRVLDALVALIQRGRLVILAVVIGAIVFVLVYGIWSQLATNRAETAAGFAESAEKSYESWQNETDPSKKSDLEKTIVAQTNQIFTTYRGSYAEERALFIRGSLAYADKDWKQAAGFFTRIADRFPTSYLAPVSLSDAAAAEEEQGNLAGAIADEKRITTSSDISAEVPEALFMIGRLYERQNDATNAKTYYNDLIDQYPSSGWTKLARDRIIALAVRS